MTVKQKVSLIIENNSAKCSIDLDNYNGDEWFAFYLIKQGKGVVDKISWQKSNSYSFELKESGTYIANGFLKKKESRETLFSFPKEYITEEDMCKYNEFLNNEHNSAASKEKLNFVKAKYPNQDFVLFSYRWGGKNDGYSTERITEKITRLLGDTADVHTKKSDNNGWNVILIGHFIDSMRDGGKAVFSGITMIEDNYVFGYDDMMANGKYEKLENNIGMFSATIMKESNVRVFNDFFNFQSVFYFMDENLGIFSNRYHLLLKVLNSIDKKCELNTDLAILSLSNDSHVYINRISNKMDMFGCNQLNHRYTAVLTEEGWKFEENEYGKLLNEPYGFTSEYYNELLNRGSQEIIRQMDSLIKDEKLKNVVVDLSGGLDSRAVYAACTNIANDKAKEKIRINSKNAGGDLYVALTINNLYNYLWDDTSENKITLSYDEADAIGRSFFMGTFYGHGLMTERTENESVNCTGAGGDGICRMLDCRGLWRYSGSYDLEYDSVNFADKVYEYLETSQIGDSSQIYERFLSAYSDELSALGGLSMDEKMDLLYIEMRHPGHFSNIAPWSYKNRRWYPLQSKSIFRLKHKSYGAFKNIELETDLIKNLNPILAHIPFESITDRKDIKNRENATAEAIYENLDIRISDNGIDSWEAGCKNKRLNSRYLNHSESDVNNEELKMKMYNACLYDLKELLIKNADLERAIGKILFVYINTNKENYAKIRNLYNKISSLTDQIEIFNS